MRRKRRIRPTWFPVLPGESSTGGAETSYDSYVLQPPLDGTSEVIAIPWIPDTSQDPSNGLIEFSDVSLRDYVEGQTCTIDRIVGKIVWSFGQAVPGETDTLLQNIIGCTAIAILPVANDVASQGSPDLAVVEYDPLLAVNSHKPWLWRRTWVLANNGAQGPQQTTLFTAPGCNEFFASRDDGPHLDTRGTKRRIGRGERLFVVHSVRGLDNDIENSTAVIVTSDLRFLGHMTKARKVQQF